MNRLYQWLQERATFFRADARIGDAQRTVRTQVTVEEEQRTMILTVSSVHGGGVCPLCGHAVDPSAGSGVLEGPIHAHCPETGIPEPQKDPQMSTFAGQDKAVRRLR